ncbi:hypothetical protein CMUS01_07677 [Colletotrichum musicola]|uniref:Uncharacterized protein n=1 Tax=Colletotrichum musicola TaxID=2175873 RepID=A0A8H6KFY6_9PEZI|nr:hypothetical protein CMUS01_07677 [Colletotrichum musicola]
MTSILHPFSGILDLEIGLFPPGRFSSGCFPAGNALGSHKSSQEPNPPSLALTPSEPDDPADCHAVCHMHPRTRDPPCTSRYASSHEATPATADAAAMSALGIMYLDLCSMMAPSSASANPSEEKSPVEHLQFSER